jgi:YD repeat-containing protein
VGTTNYVFDLDGNLIQEITPGGTTTYAYNDENRLVGVTSLQGAWQYGYDALGNRVATSDNGVMKRFVIDPIGLGNVVGEYDGVGNLLAHYDHGLGLLSRTDVLRTFLTSYFPPNCRRSVFAG